MTNLWLEPNSLAGVAEYQLGVGGRWSLSHPALTITLSPLCLWWPPSVSGLPWSGWWPGSPLWPALGGSRLSPLSPLCPPTLHSAPPPVTCSGTTGKLIPCRGWTCFREGSGFPVWLLQAPLTSCLPLAAMRAILPYIRSHFAIPDTILTTDKQWSSPVIFAKIKMLWLCCWNGLFVQIPKPIATMVGGGAAFPGTVQDIQHFALSDLHSRWWPN